MNTSQVAKKSKFQAIWRASEASLAHWRWGEPERGVGRAKPASGLVYHNIKKLLSNTYKLIVLTLLAGD